MKKNRVSLRFTLGYALLRLQRDNYSFALCPLPFALCPLPFVLRPSPSIAIINYVKDIRIS